MTLPVLINSNWRFRVNQIAPSPSGLIGSQNLMFAIVEGLLGSGAWTDSAGAAASSPIAWVVDGSSDSVTAAMDGTNRWTASTDLIWSAGNRSWIVLRNAALGGNASIKLSLGDSNVGEGIFSMSPAAGYGVANGGTDGATNVDPTAVDEVTFPTNTEWGGTISAFAGTRYHILRTADGLKTYVIGMRSSFLQQFWIIGNVGNPASGWTSPWVFQMAGDNIAVPGTRTMGRSFFTGNNRIRSAHSGSAIEGRFLAPWFTGSTSVLETQGATNQISGEFPMYPVQVYSPLPPTGRHGFIEDCWWALDAMSSGSTVPSDSSRQFASLGNFIFPWNGELAESSA